MREAHDDDEAGHRAVSALCRLGIGTAGPVVEERGGYEYAKQLH